MTIEKKKRFLLDFKKKHVDIDSCSKPKKPKMDRNILICKKELE